MFQRQVDIIESLKQAITLKVVNLEDGDKTMSITDGLARKIDRRLVNIDLFYATHQLRHVSLVECDRQEAVLQTIVQRTPLNISMEMPTLEAIKRLVENGMGVALIPRLAAETEISRKQLVGLTVREIVWRGSCI